jgi:hypothetical protein
MKTTTGLFLMFAIACASAPPPHAPQPQPAPKETVAATLVDHAGDSVETAIPLPADAPEEGVRWENDWIFDRVGRFRRRSHGTGVLNDRRYDVIEVETPAGATYKFYFDITENWKKWKPE